MSLVHTAPPALNFLNAACPHRAPSMPGWHTHRPCTQSPPPSPSPPPPPPPPPPLSKPAPPSPLNDAEPLPDLARVSFPDCPRSMGSLGSLTTWSGSPCGPQTPAVPFGLAPRRLPNMEGGARAREALLAADFACGSREDPLRILGSRELGSADEDPPQSALTMHDPPPWRRNRSDLG